MSRINHGIFWVHNDSGDIPRIFAITEDGSIRGEYRIGNAEALDWEDVAWGPCGDQVLGGSCLYIGDIGNNRKKRKMIQIYRFHEPVVPLKGPPVYGMVKKVERFDVVYPDGPHDAETLLVDPETATPYIITKKRRYELLESTAIYRFSATPQEKIINKMVKVGDLPERTNITGGDVSPDASRIVLRDYKWAYEYKRPSQGSLEKAFWEKPCRISLDLNEEPQGEALTFGDYKEDHYIIFTASEIVAGEGPIHRIRCPVSPDQFTDP